MLQVPSMYQIHQFYPHSLEPDELKNFFIVHVGFV